VILLIGIVKKNAIMMIDFALQAEREQGLSTRDAIFHACLLRFRPIMMTTMAALLGGLPLALGHGTGSEMRRPLGIALWVAACLSQMLTLFTTPVVYLTLDRFSRRRRGRENRARNPDDAPAGVAAHRGRVLCHREPCSITHISQGARTDDGLGRLILRVERKCFVGCRARRFRRGLLAVGNSAQPRGRERWPQNGHDGVLAQPSLDSPPARPHAE